MRRRLISRSVLPILLLLLQAGLAQAVSAQNLTLSVAVTPPVRGTISTASRDDRTLVVASGETVSLTRTRGIEQRRSAGGGWFWSQIEDVAADAEHVAITPRLLEDGSIEASIDSVRKKGTRVQRFSTVLLVAPGEWTELFAAGAATRSQGAKVYSTAATAGESLYLRIDP